MPLTRGTIRKIHKKVRKLHETGEYPRDYLLEVMGTLTRPADVIYAGSYCMFLGEREAYRGMKEHDPDTAEDHLYKSAAYEKVIMDIEMHPMQWHRYDRDRALERFDLTRKMFSTINANDRPLHGTFVTDADLSSIGRYSIGDKVFNDGARVNEFRRSLAESGALNALSAGHIDDLARYLDAGVNPDARNAAGYTLLMLSARAGLIGEAENLLARGALIDARNKDGSTALMLACENDRETMARRLIDNGASIHAKNDNGDTPLHMAAASGACGIISALVSRGAKMDAFNGHGDTPLMRAVEEWKLGAAELLINLGASLDPRNNADMNVYYYAMLKKLNGSGDEVLELLKRLGGDISLYEDEIFRSLSKYYGGYY